MGSNHRPLSYQDSVLPLNYTLNRKNYTKNSLYTQTFCITPIFCYNTRKPCSGFVFMIENEDKKDGLPRPSLGGVKWQPALEIFSQVSGWIAGPVILALVLGKYLDGRYGTKPWIFLGLTGIAFLVSTYGIVKVVSKYMKNIK
jgi:hypothetical protein